VADRSHLSIGEVLSLLHEEFPDVTISKIRFLESQGLVDPERTPSGYRKFYEGDVERLRWILRQQRDAFLPLRVIKGRLFEVDPVSGEEIPAGPDQDVDQGSANGLHDQDARGRAEEPRDPPTAPVPTSAVRAAAGSPPLPWSESGRTVPPAPPTPPIIGAAPPGDARPGSGRPTARPGIAESSASSGGSGGSRSTGSSLGSGAAAMTSSAAVGRGSALGSSSAGGPGRTGGRPAGVAAGGSAGATGAGSGAARASGADRGGSEGSKPGAGAGSGAGTERTEASRGRAVTGSAGTSRGAGAGRSETVVRGGSGRSSGAGASAASGPSASSGASAGAGGARAGRTGAGGGTGSGRASAAQAGSEDALTLDELAAAVGLTEEAVRDLERFGLITAKPVGGTRYYDAASATVARVAAGFAQHGVAARPRGANTRAAARAPGLIEQVVMPLIKQRNPQARQSATEVADELSRLGGELRSALLRGQLNDLH
jgi:DNA-binding transcriptional MerR regulator